MSTISDGLSQTRIEIVKPFDDQVALIPQPFRSKNSTNNINENTINNSKHDFPSTEEKESSDTSVHTLIDEISTKCKNISINAENNGDSASRIKKNAKKKERLKELKISPPSNIVNVQSTPPNMSNFRQNSVTSLNSFFCNQISPMYACNSSRYLENLVHHPNHQFMYNVQKFNESMQCSVSVPVTPSMHPMCGQSTSLPNSPVVLEKPSPPRFIQNVMQHPLLSQSYSLNTSATFNLLSSNGMQAVTLQAEQKGNHKNKKCEKNVNDNKFDAYLSVQEVEEGLKNNSLVEGVLRINPKQFQHSYISSNDRSEQDILIEGIKSRNRALEGDVIVVQLVESDNEENDADNKQRKGKVVYIREKIHNRTCIGTLKLMADKNRQKALFVPRDHRIPRLNIPFTNWPTNFYNDAKRYENTLFLAKILHWSDTRFALGKILCSIGQSGDMICETKAILAQTDLDVTPFGPDVQHLYPSLDYKIPEEEIKLREDCRKMCLFSIDPFSTRDIDDAVSCRELGNGNFEVGVHISDVAHFLAENTILDDKVAEKATTIYLVEKAYHMLPDDLCMICSLFPGVDKLAFSVFWEITKDAQVISHRFSKTVIHSCCQLAYDHAQAILEDRESSEVNFPETYNGYNYKDVYTSIKTLGHIAAILRKRRFENGALRIDQPKVSFDLNPANGLPESFWIYESQESHQLIEEFMLLANMTVANKIYNDHPKLAFLRCHPSPSNYMLKQLAKSLKPMGIELDINSAGDLHKSLLPHVGPGNKDMGKAMVLNMLCAKPMTRAKYFCADGCDDADFHHYALNVQLYTHFTSPIRRYADIMVHR